MIKAAYISGALKGLPAHDAQRMKRTYETIVKVCTECGIQARVPHRLIDPSKHSEMPDAQVYETDMRELRACALHVVEATYPSHGVGSETNESAHEGIPIVIVHEVGSTLSKHLRGTPGIRAVIEYRSVQGLRHDLGAWLREHAR